MTITVTGPDGSNFKFPDGTDAAVISGAMSKHYGGAKEPEVDPLTLNQGARALATGVPVVGGALNTFNAATNAAVAPLVEPFLSPSQSDITDRKKSVIENYKNIGGMFSKSKSIQDAMDKRFEEQRPILDTALKVTGGVAGTIPGMVAYPAAFGLTGPLSQMVTRGAASNAAIGAADAVVRGESPVAPAAVGGVVGAVAPLIGRGVGKLAQTYRDIRNPPPVVPQYTQEVAGVKVPLTEGRATGDAVKQAQEEIYRRGEGAAERVAREADEKAQVALAQASENISRSLDPTGASVRTDPQAAGQVVQSELAARAAAEEAARAAQVLQVGAQGESLARGLGGGAAPASPFDAAEKVGAAVAARRDAKVAATKEAYQARDAVAGEFDPSVPKGLAEDIRARLNTGLPEERIQVDPVNESVASRALKIIDDTVGDGSGLFRNDAARKPGPAPGAPSAPAPAITVAKGATEDETVSALRAKFGDSVADAYAKQAAKAAEPPPLSLLEFIASKGGLKPDAELDAIGMNHGHRAQIPGQKGFFGTVRKNGSDIDRMREAAEEVGYFRGTNEGTSTPREFLDAIVAELRGQKKYPVGFEDFKGKKATAATDARATGEMDRINAGHEADLADAGHGGLGPDVKQRAVALMREEGMAADDAVETAFRQLEQEDAAGAVASTAARPASGFPGDAPFPGDVPVSASAAAATAAPVDLRRMDDARKQLVTLYKDAKRKAVMQGDSSDLRAMGRVLHEFDNSISDAMAAGKFSGDAKLAKELQDAARASHAEYKQTYSAKPGDEIGRAIEKILGRYSDTAATPEQIMALSYGPKGNPGTGNAVKIAGRLEKILSPEEFAQWKSGLFKYVDDESLSAAKRATRIDTFLKTSLAKGALSADERSALSAYSRNLRAAEPVGRPANELEKAVARIAGTDGHLPARPSEVVDMLYSRTGKGDKGISQHLAAHLKGNLTPESWTAVRQGMWEKLTNAGEGKIPFEAQALSQRLHEFLHSSGKGLAEILFTAGERAEMVKLASVYKRMTPAKGTTNPSGSATIGAKIANKALDNLGAMLGFGAGGIPGAVVGHIAQKGGAALKDAKAAKEATRLFYGPQARSAVRTSRVPAILAPAIPASQR